MRHLRYLRRMGYKRRAQITYEANQRKELRQLWQRARREHLQWLRLRRLWQVVIYTLVTVAVVLAVLGWAFLLTHLYSTLP